MDYSSGKGSSCVSNSEVGGSASQTSAHSSAHTTTKPIATTTYFPTSLHYLHKSLYELVLYLEQNHIKHYDLYYD